MASVEVLIKGSVLRSAVKVRALVSEKHVTSQISNSLARQLSLKMTRYSWFNSKHKHITGQRLTEYPALVSVNVADKVSVDVGLYPVVNLNKHSSLGDGSFWDLILGQDYIKHHPEVVGIGLENAKLGLSPTPGPMYKPPKASKSATSTNDDNNQVKEKRVHHLERRPQVEPRSVSFESNTFTEYSCADSSSVSRLAINKASRQLVVQFSRGNQSVYLYEGLPQSLQERIEQGGSRGQILSIVKATCKNGTHISNFPQDTLAFATTDSV